jgi:predicted nuclease of restriction endonuclease-like (RecB) superfamily
VSDLEKKDNINEDYELLINNIVESVNIAKNKIAIDLNNTMLKTFWNIGKYIIEFEQKGNVRAEYGKDLLGKLSKDLTLRVNKTFNRTNLTYIRMLYLKFPICETVSHKLSWSHYIEILKLDDELERKFYLAQTLKENWSVRKLKRQKDTALFLKVALNKSREEILELASSGINQYKKEDVIKDIYTLEFLGLPEVHKESKLEQAIIDNLQKFLLELGKGFAFVGRQYRLSVDNEHYYADLVFYHIYLKCYVVIDLKTREIKHSDISQMNMYLGYFALDKNIETDNPPIGIILGKSKSNTMVKYATYNMDSNLFVSKYELYLPNKEELQKIIEDTLNSENIEDETK